MIILSAASKWSFPSEKDKLRKWESNMRVKKRDVFFFAESIRMKKSFFDSLSCELYKMKIAISHQTIFFILLISLLFFPSFYPTWPFFLALWTFYVKILHNLRRTFPFHSRFSNNNNFNGKNLSFFLPLPYTTTLFLWTKQAEKRK